MKFSKKYSSIDDLPMYNWKKIHDTDDLKWLFTDKVEIENTFELETLWSSIYNEYLSEFGLSDDYKEISKIKRRIGMLQADYILKEERLILNHINMEKKALESMYDNTTKGSSFRDSLVHLEKMQGIKINTKTITVADYYNYLRSIKNNG
jgi:hypothetical protein